MKKTSRIAALSLACLASFGFIASCGGDKEAPESAEDVTEDAEVPEVPEGGDG